MISKELLSEVKVTTAVTVTNGAAGTSDINGVGLDMSGFEGVLVAVRMGAITSGAVTSVKLQESSDDGSTDTYSDMEGTAQTVADTDDEDLFVIGYHKPRKRYLRLVVDRGTQNAVVSDATYYQYGARTLPVASHGSDVHAESHVSPAEGTA